MSPLQAVFYLIWFAVPIVAAVWPTPNSKKQDWASGVRYGMATWVGKGFCFGWFAGSVFLAIGYGMGFAFQP